MKKVSHLFLFIFIDLSWMSYMIDKVIAGLNYPTERRHAIVE